MGVARKLCVKITNTQAQKQEPWSARGKGGGVSLVWPEPVIQKWVLDPLELELKMIVSPCNNAGDESLVLQEQQMLLMPDPFLQPWLLLISYLFNCLCHLSEFVRTGAVSFTFLP